MKETTTDYEAAIGLFVNLAGIEASDAYGNGELNVGRVANKVQDAAEALTGRTVTVTSDSNYANALERGNGFTDITGDVADVIMACIGGEDFWDDPEPDEDEPDEDRRLREAFIAGFMATGDGWNGGYVTTGTPEEAAEEAFVEWCREPDEDETVTLTLAPDQAFEILLALGNRAGHLLTEFDPPLLASLAVVEETQAMVREAIGPAR